VAYATGSAGLALTVRGSSRWIMIMRFRPANIRLINRRQNPPRLLLARTHRHPDAGESSGVSWRGTKGSSTAHHPDRKRSFARTCARHGF
jgi:hypothetical protein